MTTWRKLINKAMLTQGDGWENLETHAPLTTEWLDDEFDDGYGAEEGCAFTLWTRRYIYFPACYDGSEWVESVARNPNGVPTNHIGGD